LFPALMQIEIAAKMPHHSKPSARLVFIRALAWLAAGIVTVKLLQAPLTHWAGTEAFYGTETLIDNVLTPIAVAAVSALTVWLSLESHTLVKRRYAFIAGLIAGCVVAAWELILQQSVDALNVTLGTTSSFAFSILSLCGAAIPPVGWMLWLALNAEQELAMPDQAHGAVESEFRPHVLVLAGMAALLGFFAVAGLTATLIWSQERSKIERNADLINLSGRQRMLSQQIARYAALIERQPHDYIEGMESVLSHMRLDAARLDALISSLPAVGKVDSEPMAQTLRAMSNVRRALWRASEQYLSKFAGRDELQSADALRVQSIADEFTDVMERVVSILGANANKHMLETTQKVTRFGILLIIMLVIGTLNVVLPVAWVVYYQHRRLDAHARMLVATREEAQRTLSQLLAYEAALSKKAIISVTDLRGKIVKVNDMFCEVSGYSRDELIGQNHRIINSGHHSPEFFREMWRTIRSGKLWTSDLCNRAKDGRLYWVDTTIVPILDRDDRINQYLSVRYDITARRYEREALRESEIHLKRAQAVAKVGSWSLDLTTRRLRWSDETYRIFGVPVGTALNYDLFLAKVHPDDRGRVNHAWQQALKGEDYDVEHRVTVDGELRYVREKADIEFDANRRALRAVGTVHDITEQKSAELRLLWQAQYDTLTELPNRRLFQDRLEHSLNSRMRDGRTGAVLMVDLDHFKNVNDSLGHKAGDDILIAAAQRLKECVRHEDTVARFGGDEFLVLLEDIEPEHASLVAEKMQKALVRPFEVEQRELHLGISIGICIFPSDGKTVDEILLFADAAMYAAKHAGRKAVCFYSSAINEKLQEKVSLVEELHTALVENQLGLVFQPIIDLRSNVLGKCEALIRWHHPSKGVLNPGQFIPVAETYGLMPEIEALVIENVILQSERWKSDGIQMQISINISAEYLRSEQQTEDLIAVLQNNIDTKFTLEITESHLMHDEGDQFARVARLVEAGAEIAIDDFGTGYSSLSYLTRLPAKYLKIDRSFIINLESPLQQKLVRSVIGIAHDVGMRVVAEGVETKDQLDLLLEYECDYAQGYLFAKPLPAADFSQYFRSFASNLFFERSAKKLA